MSRAIIIPCHPLKKTWLDKCLDSIARHDHDGVAIILALTHQSDTEYFRHVLKSHALFDKLTFFDVSAYLSRQIVDVPMNTKAVVNIKKFAALHAFDYDHAIVIDSDTEFLGPLSAIFDAAEANYAKNVFFGCVPPPVPLFGDIHRGCAAMFRDDDKTKLDELTKQGQVYTWFFDVPAYGREDVKAFFEYMVELYGLNGFFHRLTWHSFDHIVFVYYKILNGSHLVDYTDITTKVSEQIRFCDYELIKKEFGYEPIWVSRAAYHNDKQHFEGIIKMLSHTDRNTDGSLVK